MDRRRIVLFLLLLAFWLLLSGRLDPHLVVSGIIAAAAITATGAPLLDRTVGRADRAPAHPPAPELVPLTVWLLGRMARSAVQLARIVLDPRLPPEPGIVRFRTQLTSPSARMILANAITLVPGTMTLDVQGDELTVHSFTPDAVQEFASAELQNRIAAVFGDGPQDPPTLLWDSGHTVGGQVLLEEDHPFPERPFREEDQP
jgi:multicomponent Na+:H+ antiporter subunit E